MRARWIAAISIGTFVAGAASASAVWFYVGQSVLKHRELGVTEANIVSRGGVLELLHAGKTNEATGLLETLLDGDLIAASSLVRLGAKLHPGTAFAVTEASKRREKTGYSPNDSKVRPAVDEALRILPSAFVGGDAQPFIPPDPSRQAATAR